MSTDEQGLALPSREQPAEKHRSAASDHGEHGTRTPTEDPAASQASTIAGPSDAGVDTPFTSHPPSEVDLAPSATPSPLPTPVQPSATTTKHTRTATKPALPLIPIKPAKASSVASTTQKSPKSPAPAQRDPVDPASVSASEGDGNAEDTPKAAPPKPSAPKSWAELLRVKNVPVAAQAPAAPNGVAVAAPTTAPAAAKSNTLAEVLTSFSVDADKKISFLEPRGLVNTGNLCYMNSVRLPSPPP